MQLVNYLTATQLDVGLLLNFGGDSLQIRRKTRVFTANDQRREPTQAQDITPLTATTDVARGRIDAQG